MKVLQIGISSVVLVSLVSCSMFGADSKRIDYAAAATKVPSLQVPPDMTTPASDERYQVPQGESGVAALDATKVPSLEAPPDATITAGDNLKVPQAESGVAATSATEPAGLASLREISGGSTIIVMNDPFDRSWRKVGLALESAGLVVDDKDREKGIYYLRPVRLDRGWLDKLMFWKSDEDTSRHYRVNVKDGGASCEVAIVDQDGASNKVSKQMLEAIYKNINQQQ
ncbi:MAG TPA: outer membrane protein assembly factor BamC [Gallionella sp.]